MRESALQEALFKQMRTPEFYPHPVHSVTVCETHISMVFLAGGVVYKIKKSVGLEFLDFTTLENRRHFCNREVALNLRLTNNVYLGVTEITQKGDHFYLGGDGTVVEYAVRMRTLDETCSMKQLLRSGKIGNNYIDQLAMKLSEFYGSGISDRPPNMDAAFETIRQNCDENFEQTQPWLGSLFDGDCFQSVWSRTDAFLDRQKSLFFRRMENQRFRDCHGDLRTGHIYFTDTGIQIIDCIEFNERFRYGDTVLDLAFLHMDMECLGYPDAARTLMAAYAARADDPQLYALLDFYAAYRAVVRLKVSCFQLSDADAARRLLLEKDIEKYFRLAYRYTLQFSRPTVWVFCGLPATGKSMLAEHLAQTLSIPLLQSDTLRKEDQRHPSSNVVPFGSGIYRKEARDEVYARMRERAGKWLQKGDSVILDATYAHRSWRLEISRLAVSLNTNCIFVECICDPQVIRLRLMAREKAEGLSDARLEHLPKMIESFEPLSEQPVECRMQIDTDRDFQNVFYQLLVDGHYRRNEQVKRDL